MNSSTTVTAAPAAPSSSRPLALVTGAARRLGREVIEALASAGHDCLIHARHSGAEAHELQTLLQTRHGVRAEVVLTPLDDPQQATATLLAAARQHFGRCPDATVLCAATYDHDTPLAPDFDLMDAQLQLHLMLPLHYCSALARASLQEPARDRSVTLFTDYKVARVNPDYFSYSVSKHALAGTLPYLAVAFAPQLRINAIAPGPILAAHGMRQSDLEQLVDRTSSSGRHPTPQDLARTAVFLATTPSMVGQHLFVDAGARTDAATRELVIPQ